MTPVVVGIGVALVAAIVIWLVASVPRNRRPDRRAAEARNAKAKSRAKRAAAGRDADRAVTEAQGDADSIVAAAEAKAAELAADAAKEREALLVAARESAGRAAGEIRKDAKHTARRLIQESEKKAAEIVAEAEQLRARLESELVVERKLAGETRQELATFLVDMLDEVERMPKARLTNGHRSAESQRLLGESQRASSRRSSE